MTTRAALFGLASVSAIGMTVPDSLASQSAQLECNNKVVACNYAKHYSGSFGWTTATETVSVSVVDGVAACSGTATFQGRPRGIVSGPGLIGVEFVRGSVTDSAGNEGPEQLVYRVTVACPSPAVPATADTPAMVSRPAELGDFFRETYKQPAASVGMNLKGTHQYAVEDEGTVTVTWNLTRRP